MPANLTPVMASQSSVTQNTEDAVLSRFGQLTVANTTAAVATTNLTNQFGAAGVATIFKAVYSTAGIVTTTFNSNTPNQFIVSKIVFSTPVVVVNSTEYFGVVPSNTTVFNTFGSPSSLLLTAGQSDVVHQLDVVVADSEA